MLMNLIYISIMVMVFIFYVRGNCEIGWNCLVGGSVVDYCKLCY